MNFQNNGVDLFRRKILLNRVPNMDESQFMHILSKNYNKFYRLLDYNNFNHCTSLQATAVITRIQNFINLKRT